MKTHRTASISVSDSQSVGGKSGGFNLHYLLSLDSIAPPSPLWVIILSVFVHFILTVAGLMSTVIGIILITNPSVLPSFIRPVNYRGATWARIATGESQFDLNTQLDLAPILTNFGVPVLVAGLLLFPVALVGIVAIISRRRSAYVVYLMGMALVMFLQTVAFVILFSERHRQYAKLILKNYVRTIYKGDTDLSSQTFTINYIMFEAGCCGIDNFTDFKDAKNWDRTTTYSIITITNLFYSSTSNTSDNRNSWVTHTTLSGTTQSSTSDTSEKRNGITHTTLSGMYHTTILPQEPISSTKLYANVTNVATNNTDNRISVFQGCWESLIVKQLEVHQAIIVGIIGGCLAVQVLLVSAMATMGCYGGIEREVLR